MKTNEEKIDNYIQFVADCGDPARAEAYREMWAWVGNESMYAFITDYLGADLDEVEDEDEDEELEDEDDDT